MNKFWIAIVTFVFGIGMVYLFIQNQSKPTKSQAAAPLRSANTQTSVATRPRMKSAEERRNDMRVDITTTFRRYNDEFKNGAVYTGDAEQIAGTIQYFYKFGQYFSELRKTAARNELTENDLGISEKQFRDAERNVYLRTLAGLDKLASVGFTNRCLFEGGCMGSKAEINDLKEKIREWDIAPLE